MIFGAVPDGLKVAFEVHTIKASSPADSPNRSGSPSHATMKITLVVSAASAKLANAR